MFSRPSQEDLYQSYQEITKAFPFLQKEKAFFYHFYQPLFFKILHLLHLKKSQSPLVVAVSAPQGSGKTTSTQVLSQLFESFSISSLSISIDDFYLSRTHQEKLSQKYPQNPYLQQRGYPGTHDISLGTFTLSQLQKKASSQKASLKDPLFWIPRYNKSAFQGLGDRHPKEKWTPIYSTPHVVFIEGWMLGFSFQKELPRPYSQDKHFQKINSFLKDYKDWEAFFHLFILLYTPNFQDIIRWRIEAEENMKKKGAQGMSHHQVTSYIQKFIPAYEVYVPQLKKRKWDIPQLSFEIDKNRVPLLTKNPS